MTSISTSQAKFKTEILKQKFKIKNTDMKYLHELIWYLSWPLLIVVSYQSVKWMLKKFEKANEAHQEPADNFDI